MTRWKTRFLLIITASLLIAASNLSPAQAARKKGASGENIRPAAGKISSDPDSATVKEAALLKWGPVKPPLRGKNHEFLVRGVFLEATQVEGQKDAYKLTILPIEIVENNQRFVDSQNYQSGIDIFRNMPKKELSNLKKGNVIEVKQWYETIEDAPIGHAKMVSYIFHQEVVPYPASAAAFVKKVGIEPEEQINALRGIELYSGNVASENGLKEALDALSSNGKGEVKTKASQLFATLYGSQPSGKCSVAKDTQAYACK